MTDPNTLSPEQNSPETSVSPDQLSLLPDSEPTVTRLEISHIEPPVPAEEIPAPEVPAAPTVDAQPTDMPAQENTDPVSTGTKAKIISAFAIVLIAGYVAYWVQEPLQIKADVMTDTTASQTDAEAPLDEMDEMAAENVTASETVAAADENTSMEQMSGQSVNVDVSLFGFEPATLKIDKETTVIWTNTSTEDQTIIGSSPDGQSFASPVLTSGDTFNYKFDQDATFEYYSTYNPALKATLMVGLGSDIAINTTNDDQTSSETDMNAETTETANDVLADAIEETAAQDTEPVVTAETEQETPAQEELKPAANSPTKLSKTGPAETLYVGILLTIAWFNRKKLQKAFRSNR